MFEQSQLEKSFRKRSGWSFVLSIGIQCMMVGVLVIIPMLWLDVLPAAQLTALLVAPPPPPPPPPPPAEAPPVRVVKVIPRQFDAGKLLAPKLVPKVVAQIQEEELPPPSGGVGVPGGIPGGVPGGSPNGIIGGILNAVPQAIAAPPPPPPPVVKPVAEKPKEAQRLKIGGNVLGALCASCPQPTYPTLAKQARISGVVKIKLVIAKDGSVQNIQVISGHPLLVPAAMEAVKKWRYRPSQLNGEPCEVDGEITVTFSLQT